MYEVIYGKWLGINFIQEEVMTQEQFCYWLQGFMETHEGCPNSRQWQTIKDHMQTVFIKVTPNYAPNFFPKDSMCSPFDNKAYC